MTKIFQNLKTLEIELKKESKTLYIRLNRPDCWNAINTQMIKELELLFTWCANHIEINSILLTAKGSIFSNGFDFEEFKNLSNQEVKKQILLFQKIVQSMFYLPQTILVDLKDGAEGAGSEFAIGADIRISKQNAVLSFNHLDRGLVPMSGGIGFLNLVVSNSYSKQWVMSSKAIESKELIQSGFTSFEYSSDMEIEELLMKISKQAPVARIQAKRCFLQTIMEKMDQSMQFEEEFSTGSLFTNDWRTSLDKKSKTSDFVSANFYKEIVSKKLRPSDIHQ